MAIRFQVSRLRSGELRRGKQVSGFRCQIIRLGAWGVGLKALNFDSLLHALCSMPYALCPMPYARGLLTSETHLFLTPDPPAEHLKPTKMMMFDITYPKLVKN